MITRFSRRLSSAYATNAVALVFAEILISEYGAGVSFCILHDAIQSTRTYFRVRNSMAELDQRSDDRMLFNLCRIR